MTRNFVLLANKSMFVTGVSHAIERRQCLDVSNLLINVPSPHICWTTATVIIDIKINKIYFIFSIKLNEYHLVLDHQVK